MIGDYVYVISNKYVDARNPEPPVYALNGIEEKVQASEVYYFDYADYSYTFTSIMAVNLESGDFNSNVYLIGSAGNIYVSQDNIYLTYTKTIEHTDYVEEFAQQVVLPLLPSEEDTEVREILDSSLNSYEKQNKIQKIIQDYSNSLKGNEKSEFDKELLDKMSDFEFNIQKKTEKTVIHKINIDKEEINYEGVGEVPGHLLNQFSMDEFNKNFRVATTTGEVWGGNSLNHLYVLNENMEIVGSVEDLAPGEKIYSARFMGNRAYIVTFKKVDPLFVIDLSSPRNPKVLGYLKITGYSDYLHPYDENHIIGIGKETQGGNEYFSWYQGVKVSLFDVSDVENPIETGKIVIGDRGTDSDALYEHKAVLFDKEKNLLVIPIRLAEIDETQYPGEIPDNAYGQMVWQGVFVLNINENEISERGRISHNDAVVQYGPAADEPVGARRIDGSGNVWQKMSEDSWFIPESDWENRPWYVDWKIDEMPGGINYYPVYDYSKQIQRILYMDDVLYTISNAKIKANDLQSVEEINYLDLGYEENYYPYKGLERI